MAFPYYSQSNLELLNKLMILNKKTNYYLKKRLILQTVQKYLKYQTIPFRSVVDQLIYVILLLHKIKNFDLDDHKLTLYINLKRKIFKK